VDADFWRDAIKENTTSCPVTKFIFKNEEAEEDCKKLQKSRSCIKEMALY
jgi:hypothetical protein